MTFSISIKRKKIAINAANLHVGGGVQVATSFIDELSQLDVVDLSISIFVSSEVNKNIQHMGSDLSVFDDYKVVDVYGLGALSPYFGKIFHGFDLVFTIFGPDYSLQQYGVRLTGFAQAWIIYPDNEVYRFLSIRNKLTLRLRFKLQSFFFKRSSKFIVELEHVRRGLVDKGIAEYKSVSVVKNSLSSIYFTPEKWEPVDFEIVQGRFCIGYLGRDYPNKNTAILYDVKMLLLVKHHLDVDFYVTFNCEEWADKSKYFKSCINNVGPLSVAQCPSFYRKMDALIFPSLLECFSATPLEAMVMERPLFASDRDFIRDVCGDFAWYFDPTNPESAADLIAMYIRGYAGRDKDRLRDAKNHVINFSNARKRATDYMNVIRNSLYCA